MFVQLPVGTSASEELGLDINGSAVCIYSIINPIFIPWLAKVILLGICRQVMILIFIYQVSCRLVALLKFICTYALFQSHLFYFAAVHIFGSESSNSMEAPLHINEDPVQSFHTTHLLYGRKGSARFIVSFLYSFFLYSVKILFSV